MEGSWKFIFIWGSILFSLRITHQAVNVAPGGVANSSSVWRASYPANLGIDGNPNANFWDGSCFSSAREANPWWRLDMQRPFVISSVEVVRRADCCIYELQGAEIRIGDSLENNGNSNTRCAVITVTKHVTMSFTCSQMTGRYVNIFVPGGGKSVQLCEVRVFTATHIPEANVALGAVAAQSSFWEPRDTNVVIDGKPYTDYHTHAACSSTYFQTNPWIRLDLRGLYFISVIEVTRRSDCCIEAIGGTEIRIGNSLENNGNDNPRCAVVSLTNDVNTAFNCNRMKGRYVNLVIPGHNKILQPCEIKVYATTHITEAMDYCYPSASCSRDYILIRDEPKTWSEAQAYCRERYTDLATIGNAQDMKRIIDKMENALSDFWIGLHEGDATWRWSLSDEAYYGEDGAEFRNWGAGEPNEMSRIQYCVGVQPTGEWKDLDCDLLHYFLCFDGREGSPKTKILVETPMKWTDAQRYCREYHTDLLSVRNLEENQEIQSMVPAGKLAWIGLHGDSWTWSDGSTSSFRYKWQESLGSLGEGPNCGHVLNEQWSITSCDTKSMFLCYYYKKRTVVRISTAIDMSDPDAQQQILSQLDAQMRKKGISDFKIRWRKSFKQK